ncbi:MAG: translational GTPase TypA [Phycisphaerales bacterium]|jgi:GTP-binding protein|nr:translational GTPase TypA [Phycisphaerales bacterium]MDP6312053.1 translational GTPase TypA [Phycisphaerales bacterium]MDP7085989.1 translational GTPase TypA [Phycisphaerales bacterium]MDP7189680.1 translational GTPase TypA [Phycisphaerales bacterium]MDP7519719.1 translational GTPase TypA [Phycisphaerales bacterium]|tara:strand:+ start:63 stop:1937 length:1875 start_codon:yes stop_codon:yes gene_type:complete
MLHTADPNLRNLAIIAHVDHGKTTLVDSMLAYCGSMTLNRDEADCILDSDPLEKERGITITSKNCAVTWRPSDGDHAGETCRINIIDTPGHADFGGEVERVLKMADGVLLLVDAFEGPMPQTRFVLGKALELDHPLIVVINKCDRPNARPDQVLNEVFDLLVALGANDDRLDFQVIYASGRDGWTSTDEGIHEGDMWPLLNAIMIHLPPPVGYADVPLQMLIASQDYSPYAGRIAIGRIFAGALTAGQAVTICHEHKNRTARAQKVYRFKDLGRAPAEIVSVGDLCAVEGIGEFEIGDTIACPEQPNPIARIAVDEPTLHMLFRINDSPNAGRSGKYVTSRQISERLQRELRSNLALRVEPGDTAEEFRVSGRGLLHLGILLENMRREGYELTVGRPQVIEKEIDQVLCEPIELMTIDVDQDHVGPAMELLGARGGEVQKLDQRGDRMHIECEIPARGLIGLRSHMLTATGGEAVMYHCFQKYAPKRTTVYRRQNGVMVATADGQATTYSMLSLSQRGILLVEPQEVIYAGQIVGENARDNDLGVNVVKGKAFSNVRESNKEATVVLKASRVITLESALEYIQDDELVEITPDAIRLRKRILDEGKRKQIARHKKAAAAGTDTK